MNLIHGECLEEMDKLIDKGVVVDAIICDPPYGTTACKWDSVVDFDEMWERLNNLIKPNGAMVLFGAEPFSSALRMSNIKNYKYDWVWIKNKCDGFLNSKRQPLRKNEIVSVFNVKKYNPQYIKVDPFNHKKTATGIKSSTHGAIRKSKPEYEIRDYKYPSNILNFDKPKNRQHPTQKPVALMEYLIKTYTNEDETVLDFTMGSGTTGVACMNTNRNFIGIEMDDKYFNTAKDRINEA